METRGENHTGVWTSLIGCYALPEAQGHGERFVLLPSPGPVACSCLGFYFSSFQAWLHVPSSKRRCWVRAQQARKHSMARSGTNGGTEPVLEPKKRQGKAGF